LGGNRKGKSRMLLTLLIVFILIGFWHGSSFNFLVWGLIHGLFILLEKIELSSISKWMRWTRHLYVLLVVLIAWVFFRVDTLENSVAFVKKMFVFETVGSKYVFLFLSPYFIFLVIVGVLLVTPITFLVSNIFRKTFAKNEATVRIKAN
jgi:alginate O-acetyltransferase complex protein AlgI